MSDLSFDKIVVLLLLHLLYFWKITQFTRDSFCFFFFVYVEFKMTFKLFLKSKKQLQIIRCSLLTMITLLLFSAGSFAVWLRYKEWPKMDSLLSLFFLLFTLVYYNNIRSTKRAQKLLCQWKGLLSLKAYMRKLSNRGFEYFAKLFKHNRESYELRKTMIISPCQNPNFHNLRY